MTELKTLKDLHVGENPDWECSNCGMLNSSDNCFCRDCDNENYEREELKKEIKEELKEELKEKLKEELKTLKDINPFMHCDSLYKTISDYDTFSREQLKAEAVKWIKELGGETTENENTEENVAICGWIKHFFNITDEELAK